MVARAADALKPRGGRRVREDYLSLNHPTGLTVSVVDRAAISLLNLTLEQAVLVRTDGSTDGNLCFEGVDPCAHLVVVVPLLLVKTKRCLVELCAQGIIAVTGALVESEVSIHLRLPNAELLSNVGLAMIVHLSHGVHLQTPHLIDKRNLVLTSLLPCLESGRRSVAAAIQAAVGIDVDIFGHRSPTETEAVASAPKGEGGKTSKHQVNIYTEVIQAAEDLCSGRVNEKKKWDVDVLVYSGDEETK